MFWVKMILGTIISLFGLGIHLYMNYIHQNVSQYDLWFDHSFIMGTSVFLLMLGAGFYHSASKDYDEEKKDKL